MVFVPKDFEILLAAIVDVCCLDVEYEIVAILRKGVDGFVSGRQDRGRMLKSYSFPGGRDFLLNSYFPA